jgi:hypothetical protein
VLAQAKKIKVSGWLDGESRNNINFASGSIIGQTGQASSGYIPVKESTRHEARTTQGSQKAKKSHYNYQSLHELRSQKDAIREETMQMINKMGLKPPLEWKDELYRNEIMKLDIKMQLAHCNVMTD